MQPLGPMKRIPSISFGIILVLATTGVAAAADLEAKQWPQLPAIGQAFTWAPT